MFSNPFAAKRYLVVDDFGDMRTMVKGLLRSMGAVDIDAARNGSEAIELMQKARYDVVLCDYNLGAGKDGQQVLEEVKERNLMSIAAVFVMITAENTRDMVMGAVEYEPDSYLAKPFTKELLRTRLEKILRRKADLASVNDALERRDHEGAIARIDERLAGNPKTRSDLLKLKADVCWAAGRYDQAKSVYAEMLATRDVPWARLGLGKVLYMRGDLAEAQAAFERLIEEHPALTAAYDWLAKTQRAVGQAAEAQGTLQAAVALSPKAIQRQQALGELAMHNQDFAAAEKAFGRAVELGTHSVYRHPAMLAGLARSRSAAGRHAEAREAVKKIGSTFSGDVAAFFAASAEASIRCDQGDTEGALESLASAERLHAGIDIGGAPGAELELVRLAAGLGQKDKAEAILRRVIQNNHDDDDFLRDAATACRESGISDDAELLVNEARQGVIEMNNRGVRLIADGQFDEAIALFQRAAEGLPNNRVINMNAAKALILNMEKAGVDEASVGKARQFIERTQAIAPDDRQLGGVLKRFQRLVAQR